MLILRRVVKARASAVPLGTSYVFRGTHPNSQGVNNKYGIIAGKYKHLRIGDVPNLKAVGQKGNRHHMTLQAFEKNTLAHTHLKPGPMTGWISTAANLMHALGFMIQNLRPEQSFLYVIETAACEDIFDASAVKQALPTMRQRTAHFDAAEIL